MPDVSLLPVLGLGIFAVISFFSAVAESALFSLGKWKAHQMAEKDARSGALVEGLLREPQDLLATIVLSNTLANAGLVGTALWLSFEGEWPVATTITAVLLLILIGCEVIPKTLAVREPARWSLRLARPVALVQSLSAPLRRVAQWVNASLLSLVIPASTTPKAGMTETEYQELLEMAFHHGALAKSEKEIILQIINLDQRTAKEVMRPRAAMASISDELSIEEMIAAARQHKHRRLPIYHETPDTIVGILNTRELLLNPNADLADVTEVPSFVPETMNLLKLFQSFQRQQRGLAIVLDEFGGTSGVVTMTSIVEDVIGKLQAEGSTQGFVIEKLSETRWRVSGTMRLDDFRREYPSLGEVEEVETMGGWLSVELGIVPAKGDSIVREGLRLTSTVVDDRRVRELEVEVVGKG